MVRNAPVSVHRSPGSHRADSSDRALPAWAIRHTWREHARAWPSVHELQQGVCEPRARRQLRRANRKPRRVALCQYQYDYVDDRLGDLGTPIRSARRNSVRDRRPQRADRRIQVRTRRCSLHAGLALRKTRRSSITSSSSPPGARQGTSRLARRGTVAPVFGRSCTRSAACTTRAEIANRGVSLRSRASRRISNSSTPASRPETTLSSTGASAGDVSRMGASTRRRSVRVRMLATHPSTRRTSRCRRRALSSVWNRPRSKSRGARLVDGSPSCPIRIRGAQHRARKQPLDHPQLSILRTSGSLVDEDRDGFEIRCCCRRSSP